jgi:hypothetical protein
MAAAIIMWQYQQWRLCGNNVGSAKAIFSKMASMAIAGINIMLKMKENGHRKCGSKISK